MRIARLLRVAWIGLRIGGGTAATLGCGHRRLGRRALRRRRAELPQPLLELAVAVLQFLVLAGQLPQLVFQPLDPHLEVGIVGLRDACGAKASIAAIAAAPVALRNLDDILP